jgi:hypothetical protein
MMGMFAALGCGDPGDVLLMFFAGGKAWVHGWTFNREGCRILNIE